MKTKIGHLEIHIDPRNQSFYQDLFTFLGWTLLMQDQDVLGVGDEHGCGLWFVPVRKEVVNDYDGIGTNHIAIAAGSQQDVDQTVAYLKDHGVPALFETPRHRPKFSAGLDQTYYQVMFASPDNLLFEVVYTGPKTA